MIELKSLCCPAAVVLVVAILVYFVWSLCAIAKRSDERMEEQNE